MPSLRVDETDIRGFDLRLTDLFDLENSKSETMILFRIYLPHLGTNRGVDNKRCVF